MSAGLRLRAPIATAADLRAWAGEAASGDAVEYHSGLLGHDRHFSPESWRIDCIAEPALALADKGLIKLVQQRVGGGNCSYLAIRR